MIHRAYLQRSLVEVLLPDADKLWDDELRAIDRILDDEAIVELVAEALRRRRPLSAIRGRLGTPVTVVLRLLILKHLYDWSFDSVSAWCGAVSSTGRSAALTASGCPMPRH
jgi:hypothetical protein